MATAERTSYERITAEEAAALIRSEPAVRIFDVRDMHSYQQEHIEDAMHLSEDRVPLWVNRLEKTDPIIIYCYHGNSSKSFAQMFEDFRFQRVFSVDGGYRALATALEAVEAPPVAAPVQTTTRQMTPELAAFLAEWKYDPVELNAPRQHGLTPLMRAALEGQREFVQALIAMGVNIHARNDDGNTALWLACVSRDVGIVRDLIDAGIELDNRNDAGSTALMYTASSDRPELVEVLLQAGADPAIANFDDMRAVDLASSRACLNLLRHTA